MRFNGLVLRLIGGPAYRLLPSGLTEISYTGPVSGSAVRLPAQSVLDGSRFLVVAGRPEHKRWWRTFRRPQPARLMRGGRGYDVMGQVLEGPDRADALTSYLAARPGSSRGIGPSTPVIAFDRIEP
ncbi:MAG: hypothetical protein JWO11_2599 [Nocardioides sp.]|nr:hypothetical protein [Nocardioides sp.]